MGREESRSVSRRQARSQLQQRREGGESMGRRREFRKRWFVRDRQAASTAGRWDVIFRMSSRGRDWRPLRGVVGAELVLVLVVAFLDWVVVNMVSLVEQGLSSLVTRVRQREGFVVAAEVEVSMDC